MVVEQNFDMRVFHNVRTLKTLGFDLFWIKYTAIDSTTIKPETSRAQCV